MGKIDLATANEYNQVHVSLGNGTGGFSTAVNFTTATNPESITSGDFNGDGKVDLATANQGSNNTTVFLNSTDYISISATTSNICSGATSVLTASGCTTYDWSTNATTASISVTPIVTTTYSVTDGIGCSNTASTTINIPTPSVPYICMISTDSASNYQYNVIYWDKTLYNNVDSFIVYRYDVITSSYLYIGAVNKNSLSLFKDTAFSIGGPNGGNPLYSSWQYKLAIRDTCGNIGVKGPYHQSMFVQESNATFSWNAYTIESGQSNPLTGYSFLRDDNNTGSWHVLVNTSGTSATDPNYTSFPNGNWRIDALGFNCTPTFFHAVNNSTNSIANNKSHSNTTKPEATGINQLQVNKSLLAIYPNPSNGNINISSSKNIDELKVTDVLGQLIYEAKPNTTNTSIVIDNAGIYFVTINAGKEISTKKIIVNK